MRIAVPLMALALMVVSCGPGTIQGTGVVDTPENREIVDLVETYRQAVENRDIQMLSDVVSRRYFENGSTTAVTRDDYGFEELLRSVFPVLRDNVQKVTYKVSVTRVSVTGNEASAYVDWELTFQYVEGGLEGWATAKDRNRIDFVREEGRWKIIGGL